MPTYRRFNVLCPSNNDLVEKIVRRVPNSLVLPHSRHGNNGVIHVVVGAEDIMKACFEEGVGRYGVAVV